MRCTQANPWLFTEAHMCSVELKGTEKVELLTVPSMNQLIMLKTLTAFGTRIMVGKVNMHHTDG